jgi:hypothetical protein
MLRAFGFAHAGSVGLLPAAFAYLLPVPAPSPWTPRRLHFITLLALHAALHQARQGTWRPPRSFDLVFSADVLEHIHEDEAERVVAELVRVSRRHLFLSISLKPHTKARARVTATCCAACAA